MTDRLEEVREVMHLAFGIPPEQIQPSTSRSDIPEWDSVGHLNLMLGLEGHFGVSFQIDDLTRLNSVAAILEYLPSNRRLTKREWEVLSCIAEGYTNRRVAAQLSISMETVRTHVSNILAKLETPNRSAAAAKYHQLRSVQ